MCLVSSVLSPLSFVLCLQMGIALTYGMGYMLFAPICVQMLGVDLLAISFGLVQLFIGVGYIGSPIIAGERLRT